MADDKLNIIVSVSDKASGPLKSISGTLGGFATGALKAVAMGGGAAVGALNAIGGAAFGLAMSTAPLEGIKNAFTGMAEAAGPGAEAMLSALQKSAAGMVDNEQLMMSFNQAAQLVSKDFAVQLPDAMQYLGKVSAATGTDMGFMLDSLVKGVGRLSPMILDNLGIQVNLAMATEEAAKKFGVEASELSKAQIQAGMMDVVLQKLAENTAAMPDVAGSAAAAFAQFKTTLKNTKDEVGLALLPTMTEMAGKLGEFATAALPIVIDVLLNRLIPAFEGFWAFVSANVIPIIATLIGWLSENLPPAIEALSELWTTTLLPALQELGTWLQETGIPFLQELATVFIEQILPVIQENAAAIMEQLVPGLQQLGIWITDLATAALPILQSAIQFVIEHWDVFKIVAGVVGAVILALQAPILFIAGAVVLLATAWANNWGNIQGKTEAVLTFIQNIIQTVTDFISDLWDKHGATIMGIVTNLWAIVSGLFTEYTTAIWSIIQRWVDIIKGLWETHGDTIKALAENAWNFIKDAIDSVLGIINGIVAAFRSAFEGDWESFGSNLRDAWDNAWDLIVNVLETAWENITLAVQSIIDSVTGKFTDKDWGQVGKDLILGIAGGITAGIDWVVQAAKNVAKAAKDAVTGFFKSESPSKLGIEIGKTFPAGLARGISAGIPAVAFAAADLGRTASTTTVNNINNYRMSYRTEQNSAGVAADIRMLEALDSIRS